MIETFVTDALGSVFRFDRILSLDRAGYLTHPLAFSVRQLADIDDAGHPIPEER